MSRRMRSRCQGDREADVEKAPRFWIGFGDVFKDSFDMFSYYFAYHVGKDLGRALEGIWTDFEVILDSFLNDFGDHVGMLLLFIFILFLYSFQIMRSLCQEECEADVSIFQRSRCQNEFQIMWSLCQEECEADVNIRLRSRCQNEFQIMRSLCQEKCEADVKILGSRARICLISI